MEKRHLEWLNDLSSGDEVIDIQIKEFLRNVNEFIHGKDSDYRIERLERILEYLIDYSRKHFSTQEAMMERIQYPAIVAHRNEHKDFVRQLSKLYKQLMLRKNTNGEKDTDLDERGVNGLIKDTYEFIISWHDDHMLGTDKRLTDYYLYEHAHKNKN